LAEQHGYCDKSGATSILFEHFKLGFDAAISHLASVGVSGARKFWLERGSFVWSCKELKSELHGWGEPIHVIELLPVAAQIEQLEQKAQEQLRDAEKYRQECLRAANIQLNALIKKLTASEARVKSAEQEIKLLEAKMMAATSFIRTRVICQCQTTLQDVKDKYPALVCEKCQMLQSLTPDLKKDNL
jgi:hypothetical protein